MSIKAGYVAILGLPNVGKSTLLNALLGQKISIINEKPQTTRKRILGILSEENYQIIFLDTPGLLTPSYLLQEKMMEDVNRSIRDADIYILIIDAYDDPEGKKLFSLPEVKQILESGIPVILVLNKVDLIRQEVVSVMIAGFEGEGIFKCVIPLAANVNYNIQKVLVELVELLPEHPKYFPDDVVAEENERFFVSEIIREKVLELYREEIPYSVEVLINDFKERESKKDYIEAEIVVEKESQKGIIIGRGGTAIKKLGEISRRAVEEFLQKEVYLELRVKVRKNWRTDDKMLRSFGYSREKEKGGD
jgi:GTP-binding protein Era